MIPWSLRSGIVALKEKILPAWEVPVTIEYRQYLQAGSHLPFMIIINALMGAISAFLMWPQIPTPKLLTWLGLLSFSLFYRTLLVRTYRNARTDTLGRWQIIFILGSLYTGIVWGIGGILIEIYAADLHQGFAAFILGGMAGGSIMTNSAIRWNYPAFMVSMLTILSIYYLFLGDMSHMLMALMVITFMLFLGLFSFNVRKLEIQQQLLLLKHQESEQRLKDITSSMGEGVYVMNGEGKLLFINQEGERLLGWRFEELRQADIHKLIHVHADDSINSCISRRAYLEGRTIHSETEIFRHRNGDVFPVAVTASPIHSSGSIAGTVVVFADITKRRELEKQLAHMARYDALTGLLNRGSFDKKIEGEVFRANRYGRKISLLMIDIDHFKRINDTYGHQSGDVALKGVADVITASIRGSDLAARFGGEEFTVIAPETDTHQAAILAERLRKALEKHAISLSPSQEVHLTISIGTATSSGQLSPQQLIEASDRALYRAKEEGRNRVEQEL